MPHDCDMPTRDFDVDSLARYLHLTPQQVAKMADRDKLPGRKVSGQWRFSRAEIHHWLEHRIGAGDEEDLLKVESVLRRSAAGTDQPHTLSIADMLPLQAIAIPLRAKTRNSVIVSMVELAIGTGWLWDARAMIEAVEAREGMHPTALENGVALLHPRRPMGSILGQALLCLGVTPSGIPFGGGGAGLTDVFFLICSVDDPGHLRVLTRLSRVLNVPGFIEGLRTAGDAHAARQLIMETETGLPG
jgi:PTS system nitrogen regulatory IIA component